MLKSNDRTTIIRHSYAISRSWLIAFKELTLVGKSLAGRLLKISYGKQESGFSPEKEELT